MAKMGQKFMMKGPHTYMTVIDGTVVTFPPFTPFEVTGSADRRALKALGFVKVTDDGDSEPAGETDNAPGPVPPEE